MKNILKINMQIQSLILPNFKPEKIKKKIDLNLENSLSFPFGITIKTNYENEVCNINLQSESLNIKKYITLEKQKSITFSLKGITDVLISFKMEIK